MTGLRKQILGKSFRERLLGLVTSKCQNSHDAEEIVQETLLSALESLPSFKGQSNLFAWVAGIARHETADYYRKQKIKKIVFSKLPFLENLVSEALSPEFAYQELETKRKIVATFKHLSEGYSQILRLKYVERLPMRAIAIKLNISVKAVESRLTRARLAFRKVYSYEDKEFIKAIAIIDG